MISIFMPQKGLHHGSQKGLHYLERSWFHFDNTLVFYSWVQTDTLPSTLSIKLSLDELDEYLFVQVSSFWTQKVVRFGSKLTLTVK